MATFTLATGLRAANVTGLTWEQVDLARKLAWIHPDQAKARKAIARATQRHGAGGRAGAEGQASGAGVYLQGAAGQAGEQESVVQGTEARRNRGLSLARSAAHLGELARAGRNAALRVTGARRLGDGEDGAALCAPRPRNIWRSMPATRKVTAQIRHKHRISTAQPDCKSLENNEIDGGQGRNRTTDTRIFSPLLYQLSYLASGGKARIKQAQAPIVNEQS